MIVLPVRDARDEHVRRHVEDCTDGSLGANDRGNRMLRHTILDAYDEPISGENRFDQPAGPRGVVGLDNDKDQIEPLSDFSDLTKMLSANVCMKRASGKIHRDTTNVHGVDMIGPLLDKHHMQACLYEIRTDRGTLGACPDKCNFQIAP
ncbi:hypothetical protein thsrh120_60560 [Rhizobium sp. No.120]